MTTAPSIHDEAQHKWASLLPALGVPAKYLTGKNCPCPMCGGTDRFRFTDYQGSGAYWCNQCGRGSGVDLVMKIRGVGFEDAVKLVREYLPSAQQVAPKRKPDQSFQQRYVQRWRGAVTLTGDCVASKYLKNRGIDLEIFPPTLRFTPSYEYVHEDKRKTFHPAMLALYTAPDKSHLTVHATYLDDRGAKAQVPEVRKLAPGPVPKGGAIRLAHAGEIMGVAEGIETALAAMILHNIPVWACVSAVGLANWEPPEAAKHIVIFGDNDASFAGQVAAFTLAQRLTNQRRLTVQVSLPDTIGEDWNDVLQAKQ